MHCRFNQALDYARRCARQCVQIEPSLPQVHDGQGPRAPGNARHFHTSAGASPLGASCLWHGAAHAEGLQHFPARPAVTSPAHSPQPSGESPDAGMRHALWPTLSALWPTLSAPWPTLSAALQHAKHEGNMPDSTRSIRGGVRERALEFASEGIP